MKKVILAIVAVATISACSNNASTSTSTIDSTTDSTVVDSIMFNSADLEADTVTTQ